MMIQRLVKCLETACPKMKKLILTQNDMSAKAAEFIVKICDIL